MNNDTVRERLEAALHEKYNDVDLKLAPIGSRRISGLVITTHFADKDADKRQAELWKVINDTLGAESVGVSTLVTLTPDEYQDMLPDD